MDVDDEEQEVPPNLVGYQSGEHGDSSPSAAASHAFSMYDDHEELEFDDGHEDTDSREALVQPLSIPLFRPQYASTAPFGHELPLLPSAVSQEAHFNYDEQEEEDIEDSDDEDSSLYHIDSGVSSSSPPGLLSSPIDDFFDPSAFNEPRRSSRERRAIVPFSPSPEKDLTKAPKKVGRPGKNTPVRGRGRPRKYPLPTSPPLPPATHTPGVRLKYTASQKPTPSPVPPSEGASATRMAVDPAPQPARPSAPLASSSASFSARPTPHVQATHLQPAQFSGAQHAVPTASIESQRTLPPPVHPPSMLNGSISTTSKQTMPSLAQSTQKQPPRVSNTRVPPLQAFVGPAAAFFPTESSLSSSHAPEWTLQTSSTLHCKSGVMCLALSPCGRFLAAGTLLGQIYIFAADVLPPTAALNPDNQHHLGENGIVADGVADSSRMNDSTSETLPGDSRQSWSSVKWTQLAVLQDYSESSVDEWWCLTWTPDSEHIIAAGVCKARHVFDEQDGDLKILPCPLVIFDLDAFLSTPASDSPSTEASAAPSVEVSHRGIRRFEGHSEEVSDLKLWELPSTSSDLPSYLLLSTSQDGYVRKWQFDSTWKNLLYSVQMKDEGTWMAFCTSRLLEPSHFTPALLASIPCLPYLFLLAGDTGIRLFDATSNMRMCEFDDLFNVYCTHVEVLHLPYGIELANQPSHFVNGDGYLYRDGACTVKIEPCSALSFLVVSKGIDALNRDSSSASGRKPNQNGYDSSDLDDYDDYGFKGKPQDASTPKNPPSRVLLQLLTLPLRTSILVNANKTVPTKSKLDCSVYFDLENASLETLVAFSHPHFECNHWPARLAHNGRHILSVAGNGTVFAWNFSRSMIPSPVSTTKPHGQTGLAKAGHPYHGSNSPFAGTSSQGGKAAPFKSINGNAQLCAILASHDEDVFLRDVVFHPYLPFLFTAGDDSAVHVWSPTLHDPAKSASASAGAPSQAPPAYSAATSSNLHSNSSQPSQIHPISESPVIGDVTGIPCVVIPQGASVALNSLVSGASGYAIQPQQQAQGSVYRTAIEAAMLASVGSLLPPPPKRKRGRPPKKKIVEEIEAMFAAQEKAQQMDAMRAQQPTLTSTGPPSPEVPSARPPPSASVPAPGPSPILPQAPYLAMPQHYSN